MSVEMSSLSKTVKKTASIFVAVIAVLALSVWLYGPRFVIAMVLGIAAFFLVGLAFKPFTGKAKSTQG